MIVLSTDYIRKFFGNSICSNFRCHDARRLRVARYNARFQNTKIESIGCHMQKASPQSTAWESVVDPRYCFNKLTLHAREPEEEHLLWQQD